MPVIATALVDTLVAWYSKREEQNHIVQEIK
jgi:hypothetical protein